MNEDAVNRLLLQRFSVPKIKTESQADLSTIEIESKRFTLPYTEFISESEIRKSIHRIVNMSVKMAQKVVFQLLDLNKNGYIDEKDMIDLAELSLKIPEIKQDFIKTTLKAKRHAEQIHVDRDNQAEPERPETHQSQKALS